MGVCCSMLAVCLALLRVSGMNDWSEKRSGLMLQRIYYRFQLERECTISLLGNSILKGCIQLKAHTSSRSNWRNKQKMVMWGAAQPTSAILTVVMMIPGNGCGSYPAQRMFKCLCGELNMSRWRSGQIFRNEASR